MITTSEIDLFFADRTVQSAIEASRESRPLQICYPSEIPVSRFLAWLFDPTQGHGLNGSLIRRLLTACWENGGGILSEKICNKIAPSSLAMQSFADAIIQREIVFIDKRRLDVLILLPQQKLLIAIENKFGAKQSRQQLETYRKHLTSGFEGWDQVLVFLDTDSAQPADDCWIGLDYEWLIEELRVAEQSTWLGEEPRRSIRDFRIAIDRSQQADSLRSVSEYSLLEMVRSHKAVFAQMEYWDNKGQTSNELLTASYADNSKLGKALQKLLPIYFQRSRLWRQCAAMGAYAELRSAAQAQFPDVLCDAKRSACYFFLKKWESLMAKDVSYWPISVMVREQFEVPKEKTFVVISHLFTDYVKAEELEKILVCAGEMRAQRMKRKLIRDGMRRVSLRVDNCETQGEAAKLLCDHLKDLQRYFSLD